VFTLLRTVSHELRSPAHLACAFALAAVLVAAPAARAYDLAAVRSDADWILNAQLTDGAIATYVDKQFVSPYLANFASLGLTRARQLTGDRRYSDAAWKWLTWYRDHENSNGYVTDYTVNSGNAVSTGDMDSTDAYAGTYLLAVRDAWRTTHDLSRLLRLRSAIVKAVEAIESTQDADGLTWAKPAWHVKYLMDQAEVYGGLRGAAEVAQAIGDLGLAAKADGDAARLKAGFNGLWSVNTNAYSWAVYSNGVRQSVTWTVLYPDALEEVWAVAFGLADGPRAAMLVQNFGAAQPNWGVPTATAPFASGPALVGYWPVAGWAFARLGDSATGMAAADSIRSAALAARRAWPFTTGNSGQLIVLETGSPTS
jgi:hypothetical protein